MKVYLTRGQRGEDGNLPTKLHIPNIALADSPSAAAIYRACKGDGGLPGLEYQRSRRQPSLHRLTKPINPAKPWRRH